MMNIEELVRRIKNGEESKEALYNAIKPFLDFQERKFMGYLKSGEFERGDLKTLVWLGVERAIETFSVEKEFKFITWASNCIKYVIMNEYKKEKRREVPFDVVSDLGEELSMEEMVEDVSAHLEFENAETKIDGRKAMNALRVLSDEERKVIILTYIKNIPPTRVAEGMGISKGRARTLKLSALKKLKNAISS